MAIAWASNCFSSIVKQVTTFFTLEKNTHIYDFSNFGQDPGCWLLFFENDLSDFLEQKLPFSEIHKWVKLSFRGTTPLQPHAILHLLRKNSDRMALKDGIRVLSEIVLPHMDPKCKAFKKECGRLMDLLGCALRAGHTQGVERALAAVSSFFPVNHFSVEVFEFLRTFKASIQGQCSFLNKEQKASFLKSNTIDKHIQIVSRAVLQKKPMPISSFVKVTLSIAFIFSLFTQGLGASISREQFGKELALRNVSFIQKGKFSLQLCLISYQVCKLNFSPCTLPLDLRAFDCERWNLKDVDFSYIDAPFSQFVSNHSCQVTGGRFFRSDFRNSTFKNADFSGSTIHLTTFDSSQGDALFSKTYAQNISWRNLRGTFDFSFSEMQECDFAQDFSDFIARVPFEHANYTFTGARVDQGQFQVVYPVDKAPYKHITEMALSLFAAPTLQGTLIKNSNFTAENYNASAEGFYPLDVKRYFYLNDTIIENSVIGTANNTDLPYEKIQFFYAGHLNNVSFPSRFSFPIETYGACLGFHLYDVSACGFHYLNRHSAKCLVPHCLGGPLRDPLLTVENNMTIVHEQFVDALEKWDPQYIRDGLFDVRGYLEKQGLYSTYEWMSPYFLSGAKKPYDRLLFSAIAIKPINSSYFMNLSFTNTVVDKMSTITFAGNSHWENCTFSVTSLVMVGERHQFVSSTFFQASLNFGASSEMMIEKSYIYKSDIYFNVGRYLSINDSVTENVDVWGPVSDVKIFNSHLKKHFGVGGYWNLTLFNTRSDSLLIRETPEDSISSFAHTIFLNITAENSDIYNNLYGLRNATFEDVERLHVKLKSKLIRWRVDQVKEFKADWQEVYVNNTTFSSVEAFSGFWKEGGFVKTNCKDAFLGRNVTVTNMTFDESWLCSSKYLKVRHYLQDKGFKIGRNVKFIHYDSIRWPYIAVGVTGGIIGIVLFCALIYRRYQAGGGGVVVALPAPGAA